MNLGLLLLLFEFYNFSFIKDIIDNIILISVSHDYRDEILKA